MSSISASDLSEILSELLCEEHLRDLRASGLSDETIFAEGFQTVDDINVVAQELGWPVCRRLQSMGPFLRIPYRCLDGSLLNYCRYKPSNPRTREKDDGTLQIVKYEAPRGKSPPPYYPAGAIEAINTPQAPLFMTEGEKKANKATQEGFPCIGLPGISNWSKKRKENQYGKKIGTRHLNKWLKRIDWQDREVFIVFDTDDRRNPDVNREAAELARVLEQHGATVHILTLPTYWNEMTGEYEKQGLDDYLIRCGSEAFRQLIAEQTSGLTSVFLDDYRQEMQVRRTQITEPGLYLDTSPPGTGKSYLDVRTDL